MATRPVTDGLSWTSESPKYYSNRPEGRDTVYDMTYVGFVMDNRDVYKMGRLRVWIPELCGHPTDSTKWVWAQYCSPFAGATPVDYDLFAKDQDLPQEKRKLVKDSDKEEDTQKSYGFWFVPPDLQNEVVINFANGDPNRAIWTGCLYQLYMNHMVPSIPTNEPAGDKNGCKEANPPVCEYNKWKELEAKAEDQSDKPKRPIFSRLDAGLKDQGLYTDPKRGPVKRGARPIDGKGRTEKNGPDPSHVYGIKTPEGHQFVMDDTSGDEYIRLRTMSGAQVLIDNKEGYVYFISKEGGSWVEIGDQGVFIYGKSGINMRSQGDFNLHVDKNFYLHVDGKSTFLHAGETMQMYQKTLDVTVSANESDYGAKYLFGGDTHFKTKKDVNIYIEADQDLNLKANNGAAYLNSASDDIHIKADSGDVNIDGQSVNIMCDKAQDADDAQDADHKKPEKKKDRKLEKCEYPEEDRETIVNELVTHEPYKRPKDPDKKPDENTPPKSQNNAAPKSNDNCGGGTTGPGTSGTVPGVNPGDITQTGGAFSRSYSGGRAAQQASSDFGNAARQTGADYGTMMAFAGMESTWNPGTGATTGSYTGYFQIGQETWSNLQSQHPELQGKSRNDPQAGALAGGYLLQSYQQKAAAQGVNPTPGNLYLYQFAPNGHYVQNFLNSPDDTPLSNFSVMNPRGNFPMCQNVGCVKQYMAGMDASAAKWNEQGNPVPAAGTDPQTTPAQTPGQGQGWDPSKENGQACQTAAPPPAGVTTGPDGVTGPTGGTGTGTGGTRTPEQGAQYAAEHAAASSQHACGKNVGDAMGISQSDFAQVTGSTSRDGYKYDQYLSQTWGAPVASGAGGSISGTPAGYTPQNGDIAVFEQNSAHTSGHVQTYYNGTWYSDYKQGSGKDPSGFAVYKNSPSYHIYRKGS